MTGVGRIYYNSSAADKTTGMCMALFSFFESSNNKALSLCRRQYYMNEHIICGQEKIIEGKKLNIIYRTQAPTHKLNDSGNNLAY